MPVPYLRWKDRTAILIASNRNQEKDANLRLKIDLSGIGLDGRGSYTVTDLWSSTDSMRLTQAELEDFNCVIKRDGVAGGGARSLQDSTTLTAARLRW